MSVYDQTFILYGFDMGWNTWKEKRGEVDDSLFKDKYDDLEKYDIVVIADGRSGRYAYIGVYLASTNSTRDGPQRFDNRYSLRGSPKDGMMELGQAIREFDLEPPGDDLAYKVFTHTT